MDWSTMANVLGFVSLAAAGFTIAKVESAELGEYSSRLVGTVIAVFVYFGIISIGGIVPELPAVKFEFLKYLVSVLGAAGIVYCGWKVYQNRSTEIRSLIKSGWKLLLVVGFALLARILLSL